MTDSDANTQSGKNGAAPTGRIIGAIIAILLAVAVVVALVVRGGDEDTQDTAQEPPATGSTTEQPPSPEDDEGENLPGAAVGNKQRTWPFFEDMDDSAHATPGKTSASWMHQRPVWTPINHDGDFPKKSDLKNSMAQCDKPDSITLDGKTQQQYVNARYLVVNDQAGPTKSVRGVPRGYAHTPQGAIVSAINTVTYGFPDAGDEVGYEAEKQLWATSKSAKEMQDERREPFNNERARAELTEPADGFKVRTCSDDLVVVEVVMAGIDNQAGEAPETVVARVPMAWSDGDWIPDFSGTGDDQLLQPPRPLSEFTKVDYR